MKDFGDKSTLEGTRFPTLRHLIYAAMMKTIAPAQDDEAPSDVRHAAWKAADRFIKSENRRRGVQS
jgi:hypothetical protein